MIEARGRRPRRGSVFRRAGALQASVLVRKVPAYVADAFCYSRLEARGAHQYGALPSNTEFRQIVERARPR